MNEKIEADHLGNYLSNKWKIGVLHGGKTQDQREHIMEKFREGRLEVLITTDVFSRGIDVKYLKTVVNYDCPKTITDYEHRIGRTGRMGKKGTAVTFLTTQNQSILPLLKTYLLKTGQKIPQELENICSKEEIMQ